MIVRRLKLNADRTEFLIVDIQRQCVQNKNLFPVSTRNLGVHFDDKCNFTEHISQTCRTCYYHICH